MSCSPIVRNSCRQLILPPVPGASRPGSASCATLYTCSYNVLIIIIGTQVFLVRALRVASYDVSAQILSSVAFAYRIASALCRQSPLRWPNPPTSFGSTARAPGLLLARTRRARRSTRLTSRRSKRMGGGGPIPPGQFSACSTRIGSMPVSARSVSTWARSPQAFSLTTPSFCNPSSTPTHPARPPSFIAGRRRVALRLEGRT